jgi:hypothetical protein
LLKLGSFDGEHELYVSIGVAPGYLICFWNGATQEAINSGSIGARYAIKSNDFLSLATLNYDPSGYDYDISQP